MDDKLKNLNISLEFLKRIRYFIKSNSEEVLEDFQRYYNTAKTELPVLSEIIFDKISPKYTSKNLNFSILSPSPNLKVEVGDNLRHLATFCSISGEVGEYSLYEEMECKTISCRLYIFDILRKLDKVSRRNLNITKKIARDSNKISEDRVKFLSKKIELSYKAINILVNGAGLEMFYEMANLKDLYTCIRESIDEVLGNGASITLGTIIQSVVGRIDEEVKINKKIKFRFNQDRWVKTIITDKFEVEASSYEEAVSIIKGINVKDLRDSDDERIELINTECLDREEDINLISFTESCGKPTVTIYGFDKDWNIDIVKDNREEFRNGAS